MTKVKICGITNLEDALLSAKFGADALGFNFYAKSPRSVAPEKAREIIEQVPPEILKVGVFVNESLEKIREIAETAKLNAIQLHGEETPEFVREIKTKTNLEIIKAFRVSPEFNLENVLRYEVDAILLDAYSPEEHGGTGETFDWEIAGKVREIFPKMYLAGGLTHENIVRAVGNLNPYGVDVCSGIESRKGVKDKIKLINFITKAKTNLAGMPKENLWSLFSAIYLRPQMYLGEKSLSKLQTFLHGFFTALHLAKANFETGKYESEEFRKWMGEKVGYGYPNSISCMTHILRKLDNDEAKAFDLFFALLEEFKLEKENLSMETAQWNKASDKDLHKFEQNLEKTN
ncbi:MAG TPA: phosphoribosylanthranilate isomerase [Pyrinomonadaceae bacterium]|jgi:phosphoribosylanthranilate isomerase